MRRFTRLALGFSKKIDNLAAATALHVRIYNFVRIHQTLGTTPAVAAGVTSTLYRMPEFFDAVTQHAKDERKLANTRRLVDRLNRGE